jgi:hypothetical protein
VIVEAQVIRIVRARPELRAAPRRAAVRVRLAREHVALVVARGDLARPRVPALRVARARVRQPGDEEGEELEPHPDPRLRGGREEGLQRVRDGRPLRGSAPRRPRLVRHRSRLVEHDVHVERHEIGFRGHPRTCRIPAGPRASPARAPAARAAREQPTSRAAAPRAAGAAPGPDTAAPSPPGRLARLRATSPQKGDHRRRDHDLVRCAPIHALSKAPPEERCHGQWTTTCQRRHRSGLPRPNPLRGAFCRGRSPSAATRRPDPAPLGSGYFGSGTIVWHPISMSTSPPCVSSAAHVVGHITIFVGASPLVGSAS